MPANSQQTIGDRLKQAKQDQFIGRRQELRRFETALADNSRPWQILNIIGPGGVGKSTLLDAFRRCAEANKATYLYINTLDFGNSVELFTAQLCAMLPTAEECHLGNLFAQIKLIASKSKLIIAIDTFEEIGEMNRWLREEFLAKLPSNCMIIIAGRHPLTDLWQAHHAWHSLIESMVLDNFDQEMTAQYLQQHGVNDTSLIENAWHYTSGYPLALSLSVMLAQRDGQTMMSKHYNDANIVSQLTQRWLREIPDDKLRPFIEAAAIVRFFNQDLLEQISDQKIDDTDFLQLINCSFVRSNITGWSIHNLVRDALTQELSQRSPEHYMMLRIRALSSLAHNATQQSLGFDRPAALQEFFYLLGDSLVRAALYNEETEPSSDLYLDSASHDDIKTLEQYMDEWRLERGVLSNVDVELFDSSSKQSISQHIASEPREPEFINIRELIECFPGAIRILKNQINEIHGLTIVLPINSQSIDYLQLQPVISDYFKSIPEEKLSEMTTPGEQTRNWFVRLVDTRNPSDNTARAMLFRDLTALLIKPARFITSTGLELYQSLLARFGFVQLELPPTFDFGNDRPSPYYELDLRGRRLAQHLNNLMNQHIGIETNLPFESLLADINLSSRNEQPKTNQSKNTHNTAEVPAPISLENLTQREREVALAAVEGLPNCSIAAHLDICEVTVKKHMSQIFRKLGLRNRSELIKRFWSQEHPQHHIRETLE